MGGGKSDFFTMEPPLEPPAVQEGPSDPPKFTFGAKMELGPKKHPKMTPKGPHGAPETQQIPQESCKKPKQSTRIPQTNQDNQIVTKVKLDKLVELMPESDNGKEDDTS